MKLLFLCIPALAFLIFSCSSGESNPRVDDAVSSGPDSIIGDVVADNHPNDGGANADGSATDAETDPPENDSEVNGNDSDDTVGDSGTAEPPPNILLVILDDFGLDFSSFDPDSPCYDVGDTSNDPIMPNIASLCANGLRFTNAWATPTCSPTRASMLTGTHPYQHGVTGPLTAESELAIPLDSWTLPRALRDGGTGYATANIGKWHISLGADDPNTVGWDHYAGVIGGGLGNYSRWERTVNGPTKSSRNTPT